MELIGGLGLLSLLINIVLSIQHVRVGRAHVNRSVADICIYLAVVRYIQRMFVVMTSAQMCYTVFMP